MIGQALGHYEILEQIGAGGMGVVYRARDTRLDRIVAIKVLGQLMLGDETARERFLREARTISALNHPNICTIFEVNEVEGQIYIAMEFVEGKPLSALALGPGEGLPLDTAIRYGIQIADALDHAHERGIVHRDLKGTNVLITPEGRVKVLDFGLAKKMRNEVGELTRSERSLTAVGGIVGTLGYIAPEVLRGQQADARSDLWALGIILYEMVTGDFAFKGNTAFEITSSILRDPPGPLSDRVPPGLRATIQRCLAKEPAQRYPRAGEVRSALEMLQSGILALPVVPEAARGAPWSRRRWLWAAGVVGLLTLAGGAGVTLYRQRSASPMPVGPVFGARPTLSKNPEANEYFEKAMLFLRAQYDLTRARQMLERALQLDPHFAEARGWYGLTYVLMIDSGYSNDTSFLYKAEEEIRRALADDPNSARAHSALAAVYAYQGRKELVPGEAEKALKANPAEPAAYIWLSNYHALNGDYAEAQDLLKKLLDRDPLFFPARINFGENLRQQGDVAGAIREQEKVLEQDPQNLYALLLLAEAYMTQGELAKARQALERGRPADRQNFLVRLPWALLFALEGKRKEALQEMNEELLKFATAHFLATYGAAEFYAVMGEPAKSLEWLDRAVRNGDERAEWFRRDALLANIRSQPRFRQILESIAFRRQQRG
ncbi:MAG: protein kinase [Acidobacteria bacterium]|nr:protein kinase [Acidobacteriota bacterium]